MIDKIEGTNGGLHLRTAASFVGAHGRVAVERSETTNPMSPPQNTLGV